MTKIFPAIDIMYGSCVRLTEGKITAKTDYNIDPLEMAKKLENAGARYLHIVDLDAAMNKGSNKKVIRNIVSQTSLMVETGGGIRSLDDINMLLDYGVSQCILGSVALTKTDQVKSWINEIGTDSIVIGADMLDGKIVSGGWEAKTDINLDEFIEDFLRAGAQKFLCTDVSKDGKLGGSALELYEELQEKYPLADFIASGGVTTLEEIEKLKNMDMYGIIIGKALYENTIEWDKLFAL